MGIADYFRYSSVYPNPINFIVLRFKLYFQTKWHFINYVPNWIILSDKIPKFTIRYICSLHVKDKNNGNTRWITNATDQYFGSKFNIWNVNCARATAFIFGIRTGVLVKVSKLLIQKMSRSEGIRTPNFRIHVECSNQLSYHGHTFAVPCFYLISGSGVFEVNLTFEILNVRGQQHSCSTHERVFLWKCQNFWDRKCLDLRGTRTPNLRIHTEYSNHSRYQGQTLLSRVILILALVV